MVPNSKKIIAVVGMAGSGKTEVINYLVDKYHWPKVYFGEATFEELKKEGLEVNPENERKMREKIRKEQGMDAYAKLSLPKIIAALKISDIVLVESLYSWAEYKFLKEKFGDTFRVVAIFASPALRFSRLKQRAVRPIREFEEFRKRDWSEIEGTDKGGPIAIADHTIINDGSLAELHKKIDKVVEKEKEL